MQKITISFLFITLLLASSAPTAETAADASAIPYQLRQLVSGDDAARRSFSSLKTFYRSRAYRPVWFDHDGRARDLAEQLWRAVRDSASHGLNPQHYDLAAIASLVRGGGGSAGAAGASAEVARAELRFSDAFFALGNDLLRGRVDPKSLDSDWPFEPRRADLVEVLRGAVERRSVYASLQSLAPASSDYRRLRAALQRYAELEAAGGWPNVVYGNRLRPGARDTRVPVIRDRLRLSGDAVGAAAAGDRLLYDDGLAQSVRRFQRRHGIKDDGLIGMRTSAALATPVTQRIDQIKLNLERLRWLPEYLGRRYVLVNIAGFSLRLIEDGHERFSSAAVVGRYARPTPLLSDQIRYIVLSPYWHVPHSIAVEDKLPQLQENPSELERAGFRLFRGGREIALRDVDWRRVSADNFPYTLRQDPGPGNALGGIKFMFPNRHSVYIHDTSGSELFSRSLRPYSSGCVRVGDPYALAELLLDSPVWTRDALRAAARRPQERRVNLADPLPVYFLYWTSWVDDSGAALFFKDIYRRDEALARALWQS